MNKAGGFITLHRQILDWEWYKDINTKVLFLHLLLKANYKDLSFEGRKILRGQLVTSLSSLSSQLGLTQRQIRVSLDKLKMTGEVTSTTYSRYRVITIVNYNEYQDDDKLDDSQMTDRMSARSQADDKLMTSSRQADDKLMTTSKQRNNSNKGTKEQGNNKDISLDGFNLFWENYPKKIGKPNAMKAFKKIHPDDELLSTMLEAIVKQKATAQWQEANGQFIPYPATWLNNRRWEDEVQPASGKAPDKRIVVAQDYEQRDYAEDREESITEMMNRLKREMEEGL